jgi:hypothetical protein
MRPLDMVFPSGGLFKYEEDWAEKVSLFIKKIKKTKRIRSKFL